MARRTGNLKPGTYARNGSPVVVPTGRTIYILNSDRTSTRRGLHVRLDSGEFVRVSELRSA